MSTPPNGVVCPVCGEPVRRKEPHYVLALHVQRESWYWRGRAMKVLAADELRVAHLGCGQDHSEGGFPVRRDARSEHPGQPRWALTPTRLDDPIGPDLLIVDCSTCGEVARVAAGPDEHDLAVRVFADHQVVCPDTRGGAR